MTPCYSSLRTSDTLTLQRARRFLPEMRRMLFRVGHARHQLLDWHLAGLRCSGHCCISRRYWVAACHVWPPDLVQWFLVMFLEDYFPAYAPWQHSLSPLFMLRLPHVCQERACYLQEYVPEKQHFLCRQQSWGHEKVEHKAAELLLWRTSSCLEIAAPMAGFPLT